MKRILRWLGIAFLGCVALGIVANLINPNRSTDNPTITPQALVSAPQVTLMAPTKPTAAPLPSATAEAVIAVLPSATPEPTDPPPPADTPVPTEAPIVVVDLPTAAPIAEAPTVAPVAEAAPTVQPISIDPRQPKFDWNYGAGTEAGNACTCNNSPDLNCDDFANWSQSQACFEKCGGLQNDVYELDKDKDAVVCENPR